MIMFIRLHIGFNIINRVQYVYTRIYYIILKYIIVNQL